MYSLFSDLFMTFSAHWRNIIRRKVNIHSEFQLYLVEKFLYKDIDEAVYWANEFQLDESMYDAYELEMLTMARNEGRGIINDSDDFNEEELDNHLFYSLKLNSEDIVFVSSLDEFDEMVKYISQQVIFEQLLFKKFKTFYYIPIQKKFFKFCSM